ncbi:hypothetical protein M413DRAFT_423942 [Hebeloma cylindrosporum]|uniref:Uncharacterized protein n=1 Tax=Hebeloma cylindrosporum TaxID=76867 RepID=A0A0C3BK32_HEBCY|nr:hypothetical protein M413DRAFT_423942 [Hebeloma cylindrosporum h7]
MKIADLLNLDAGVSQRSPPRASEVCVSVEDMKRQGQSTEVLQYLFNKNAGLPTLPKGPSPERVGSRHPSPDSHIPPVPQGISSPLPRDEFWLARLGSSSEAPRRTTRKVEKWLETERQTASNSNSPGDPIEYANALLLLNPMPLHEPPPSHLRSSSATDSIPVNRDGLSKTGNNVAELPSLQYYDEVVSPPLFSGPVCTTQTAPVGMTSTVPLADAVALESPSPHPIIPPASPRELPESLMLPPDRSHRNTSPLLQGIIAGQSIEDERIRKSSKRKRVDDDVDYAPDPVRRYRAPRNMSPGPSRLHEVRVEKSGAQNPAKKRARNRARRKEAMKNLNEARQREALIKDVEMHSPPTENDAVVSHSVSVNRSTPHATLVHRTGKQARERDANHPYKQTQRKKKMGGSDVEKQEVASGHSQSDELAIQVCDHEDPTPNEPLSEVETKDGKKRKYMTALEREEWLKRHSKAYGRYHARCWTEAAIQLDSRGKSTGGFYLFLYRKHLRTCQAKANKDYLEKDSQVKEGSVTAYQVICKNCNDVIKLHIDGGAELVVIQAKVAEFQKAAKQGYSGKEEGPLTKEEIKYNDRKKLCKDLQAPSFQAFSLNNTIKYKVCAHSGGDPTLSLPGEWERADVCLNAKNDVALSLFLTVRYQDAPQRLLLFIRSLVALGRSLKVHRIDTFPVFYPNVKDSDSDVTHEIPKVAPRRIRREPSPVSGLQTFLRSQRYADERCPIFLFSDADDAGEEDNVLVRDLAPKTQSFAVKAPPLPPPSHHLLQSQVDTISHTLAQTLEIIADINSEHVLGLIQEHHPVFDDLAHGSDAATWRNLPRKGKGRTSEELDKGGKIVTSNSLRCLIQWRSLRVPTPRNLEKAWKGRESSYSSRPEDGALDLATLVAVNHFPATGSGNPAF